jgi:hypothetical protein
MIAQLWLMQPHGWARAELTVLIGIFSGGINTVNSALRLVPVEIRGMKLTLLISGWCVDLVQVNGN